MKKILLTIPVLAVVVLIISCSSDEPALSQTELLTRTAWVSSAKTISPALLGLTNIMMLEPTCMQDNSFTFSADGNFIVNEETEKCSPETNFETTYTLNTDVTTITLADSMTFDYTYMTVSVAKVNITELTKNKLVCTCDMEIQGQDYVATLEFEPK
jgi:hypothetical protein